MHRADSLKASRNVSGSHKLALGSCACQPSPSILFYLGTNEVIGSILTLPKETLFPFCPDSNEMVHAGVWLISSVTFTLLNSFFSKNCLIKTKGGNRYENAF